MNPKHVHTPVSTRARCPVCHQAVYSRAGIHPQCAMRQSEPPRVAKPKPVPAGVEPAVALAVAVPEPVAVAVAVKKPTPSRTA